MKKITLTIIAIGLLAGFSFLSYTGGKIDGYHQRRDFEIKVIIPMQRKWINRAILESRKPLIIFKAKPKSLKI